MPFAGYKDFDQCVKKNKDKKNPEGYCASIHKKATGKWPNEKNSSNNKGYYSSVYKETITKIKPRGNKMSWQDPRSKKEYNTSSISNNIGLSKLTSGKKNPKNPINTDQTFKQGIGGGIVGAFFGAPGLGAGIGILHANRDKLKKFGKNIDKNLRFR